MISPSMKKHELSRHDATPTMRPGREHWWWRENTIKRALNGNRQLDHFFSWRIKGRSNPSGAKWTPAQRREIETGLWLYELDARISQKYLFGRPAHLLAPERLSSVVAFANPISRSAQALKTGEKRRTFSWAWIESYDKRNDPRGPTLTRAELNGIIAAMKYCLAHFLHR